MPNKNKDPLKIIKTTEKEKLDLTKEVILFCEEKGLRYKVKHCGVEGGGDILFKIQVPFYRKHVK